MLRFVAVQTAQKFVVGIALHWNIPKQFSDEVLAVKAAFASTLVDADFSDPLFNFPARNHFPSSAVFSSSKPQNAGIFAFFPLSVGFFSDVSNVSRDHMR
jgi:hypothetical protein